MSFRFPDTDCKQNSLSFDPSLGQEKTLLSEGKASWSLHDGSQRAVVTKWIWMGSCMLKLKKNTHTHTYIHNYSYYICIYIMNICNSKQVHHLGKRYFWLHLKLLGVLHAVKNAGDLPKHWTTASCEQESLLCHPLSTWVAAFLGRLSSKVSSGAAMGFEELGRGWAGDHSQKLQRKQPGAKDGIVV